MTSLFAGLPVTALVAIFVASAGVIWVAGIRGGPSLTYRAASLTLVIEGLLVIAVLVTAIMAAQLPNTLVVARLTPGALVIASLWLAGVWLVGRANSGLPWHDDAGDAPDTQNKPKGHSKGHATTIESLLAL